MLVLTVVVVKFYPSGEKSNNNVYVATTSGKISEIERAEKGNKINRRYYW